MLIGIKKYYINKMEDVIFVENLKLYCGVAITIITMISITLLFTGLPKC